MLLLMISCAEREGLLVTRWMTESSTYKRRQSIMVSHIAVDQFNSSKAVDQLLYGIPS